MTQARGWGMIHGMIDLSGSVLDVGVVALGARLALVRAPDRDGRRADVVLGLTDYADDTAYLGATVGRYANRIAGGTFVLDGNRHQVPCNEGEVALHGGPAGFARHTFTAAPGGGRARTGRTASPARSRAP